MTDRRLTFSGASRGLPRVMRIGSALPGRAVFPSAEFYFDGELQTPTHAYIVFDKLNHEVIHSDGPRPSPMPNGQEWYRVAGCVGEIHESGF